MKHTLALLSALLLAPLIGLSANSTNQGTFNVRQHGAAGDGKTLDTAAIQKTIDAAAATGGGIVLIPSGTYLTQ